MLAFLDTNIFAYTFDVRAAPKRERARELVGRARDDRSAIISYQVVQECLHFLTRKLATPMTQVEAHEFLTRTLMPICKVFPDEALYAGALSIASETGWSFYDSLIVSAAVAGDCAVLYTEDLQHGRTIRGMKIQNPFVG